MFKMMVKVFFSVLTVLVLFQAQSAAHSDTNKSPSACHCRPVINVAVDGNGQCDLCEVNNQLLQAMKELKEELTAIKNQTSQKKPELPQSPPFDLMFTRAVTSDYVIHHGLQLTDAFTICFRLRTTGKTPTDAAIVSYSTSTAFNEILIKDLDLLEFWIHDYQLDTGVQGTNDGYWHHICVTWENKAGYWKVYKDGVSQIGRPGAKTGHVIKTDGILTIGQDQDSLGGQFDVSQSYAGELTDLNMWNKVLNATEILNLSKACHGGEGNVKKWSDFKVGISGHVKVVSPSACNV